MPRPRKSLISLSDTPYYHCMSRCVRRAFLCGIDQYTGNNYEHRRAWLEEKLHETANAFAIKLCTYAIMHNHYHVVLNVRTDIAESWTDLEVVQRWHTLFSGTLSSQQFEMGCTLEPSELKQLQPLINLWRKRLSDISWFMRIINEAIARRANSEDKCTGRFWEGRFKSQALLDDSALLSCMSYVDLNPIRSRIASTPETSDFTGVQQRIEALNANTEPRISLEQFIGSQSEEIGLPFLLAEYLELVDWTGRLLRHDKRGAIDATLPPIIEHLGFNQEKWNTLATTFETQFSHWVGKEDRLRKIYRDKHYQRIPSTKPAKTLFG